MRAFPRLDMRFAVLLAFAMAACSRPPEARETGRAQPIVSAPIAAAADAGVPDSGVEEAPDPSIAAIDQVVDAAIARGDAPGAVVVVSSGDRIVHRKAYGQKRVSPAREPMTVDTVFDLASLTKPIVTATSIHLLIEDGKLRLTDRASKYLPELAADDKKNITVEQLLLHTAGFPADNALSDYRDGGAAALKKIGDARLAHAPGKAFVYSDVGYILLGAIVARVSGEGLDAFAKRRLFDPLVMRDTAFLPGPALVARAAPTEPRDGIMLVGKVHDPRAALLGGVAGHAGLFSTADDLILFARMLLHHGASGDKQVLSKETVATILRREPIPGGERTLGWDVHYGLSPVPGIGHTGFTGTSLWIDPSRDLAVVLLTSRLHPDGKGNVTTLRHDLNSTVANAMTAPVLAGIDVLAKDGFKRLKGHKIALVTNKSAVDRAGHRTVDTLREGGVDVVVLLAPEHGLDADADAFVASGTDKKSGLPIKSLYGADRRKPAASDLAGADTLVFDIQDAGVRFYTFETTLGLMLESAKELGLDAVVLDRPNPLGSAVEGPLVDVNRLSFIGYHPVPLRHGMTVGELSKFFNTERSIGARLDVIKMDGWKGDMLFRDTGLAWIAPSPNLKSDAEALLYPGLAILEATNVSVGRGTDTPFEVVGAPWIDGPTLATELSKDALAGVSFRAARFTPSSSTHAKTECGGVAITITDPKRVASVRLGVAIALALKKLYASKWETKNLITPIGNRATIDAILRGDALDTIVASWKADEQAFVARRKASLLYSP